MKFAYHNDLHWEWIIDSTRTHLAHIFIHLILSEWALILIIAKEPKARGTVQVVVSDIEVIGPSGENAYFIFPTSWLDCSRLLQSSLGKVLITCKYLIRKVLIN